MWRLLFAALVVLPAGASAKPWNGITPGSSSSFDVINKFGEPSRKLTQKGKDVLVYSRDRAIKATVQSQFRVDPQTQIVERIDVYPEPVIEADAIESSYGPECQPVPSPPEPCYTKKTSAEKKLSYFLYFKLGLAIFFKPDTNVVQSFSFLPVPAGPSGASATP